MSSRSPIELIPGEELLLETRPHPLAMFSLVLFWLMLGAFGALQLALHDDLTQLMTGLLDRPFVPDDVERFVTHHAHDVVWLASVLVPLLIMAVFRINFGYILTLLVLIAGHVAVRWKLGDELATRGHESQLGAYLLLIVAAIGVIGCELFRRGHRYYLTDQRIVARFGTLRISERSTLYSKIDDLVLETGMVGRLFGFGTVIPITSSGLGMGQDMAIAGGGVGASAAGLSAGMFAAGGKGENVTRDKSIYVLYRVANPESTRNLVLAEMTARERPRRSVDG